MKPVKYKNDLSEFLQKAATAVDTGQAVMVGYSGLLPREADRGPFDAPLIAAVELRHAFARPTGGKTG